MLRRLLLLFTTALVFANPAGAARTSFEQRTIPAAPDGPIEIGIWAPAGSRAPLPLIIISHGTGGDFRSHIDTAKTLSAAGFIVAALTHPGDNWRDSSSAFAVWRRPRHLKQVVDYMLQRWPSRRRVDRRRIGAFGFSAGGFTVLVAAGGVPELGRIRDHCRANPRFFECGIAATAPALRTEAIEWTHDKRLSAVAAAAPALGFTFEPGGLRSVNKPVQLWRAEKDQILPHPFYVEPVRRSLPTVPDYRLVANAGHFDFLSPCSQEAAALRPHLCSSAPGFDRQVFHEEMNRELIRFFRKQLRSRPPQPTTQRLGQAPPSPT